MSSGLGRRGTLKCIHSGGEFDGVIGPCPSAIGPDLTRTPQLPGSMSIVDKARAASFDVRWFGRLCGDLRLVIKDQSLLCP